MCDLQSFHIYVSAFNADLHERSHGIPSVIMSHLSHNPMCVFLFLFFNLIHVLSHVKCHSPFIVFVGLSMWTSSWPLLQRHRMPTQMQTLLILTHSRALLGLCVVSLQRPKPHSQPQAQVDQVAFTGHIPNCKTTFCNGITFIQYSKYWHVLNLSNNDYENPVALV